jgi:hypothetical protein
MMSGIRSLYLVLTIAGLAMPWYFNFQFIEQYGGGFNIQQFMADSSLNAASKSLGWDLMIACLAGLSWIYFESKRLGMKYFWVYILLAFGIAYAFAFPLFLFMRQGKLESMDKQQ